MNEEKQTKSVQDDFTVLMVKLKQVLKINYPDLKLLKMPSKNEKIAKNDDIDEDFLKKF